MSSINRQDKEVSQYLIDKGIKTSYALLQQSHDLDEWECDKWLIKIGGESFEYHTDTGHRLVKKSFRCADKKDQKFIRELKALWDVRHMVSNNELVQPVPPTQASVLHCVLLDTQLGNETFNNWCADLCYDTDSRKAMDIYLACQENGAKLSKVFSADQINELETILEDY
ncbi:MAG: hypothetical protein GY820_21120 [Gammaproteobacteria bacterium]|nr:hypothetical protein [Gammaproteobacteria bacterium]